MIAEKLSGKTFHPKGYHPKYQTLVAYFLARTVAKTLAEPGTPYHATPRESVIAENTPHFCGRGGIDAFTMYSRVCLEGKNMPWRYPGIYPSKIENNQIRHPGISEYKSYPNKQTCTLAMLLCVMHYYPRAPPSTQRPYSPRTNVRRFKIKEPKKKL